MADGRSGASGVAVSVLVLESNEGLQRLVHVWLASRNLDHTQVLDPQHALAACAQVKYSVIFVDIDDPVTNGLAIATAIRSGGRSGEREEEGGWVLCVSHHLSLSLPSPALSHPLAGYKG